MSFLSWQAMAFELTYRLTFIDVGAPSSVPLRRCRSLPVLASALPVDEDEVWYKEPRLNHVESKDFFKSGHMLHLMQIS